MSTQESRTSRGIQRRKSVIDLNEISRDHEGTTSAASVREASTVVPSQPVPSMIDVDAIEDDVIESSASAFAERESSPKPPPPLPEELDFSCPICMCPFTEETSTKCGHIFCKGCIKMTISHQAKCPTHRKKGD